MADLVTKPAGPYRCAGPGCTAERHRDANRWWLMYESEGILHLRPWSDELAAWPMVEHVCGMRCAQAIQDQYMQAAIAMETVR